ncbi:hypothetical protein AB0K00_49390 [Dactylosporangium sp. NPDC049525]|uniref:hypothetical protein n=1 Tax=Dactylosporangium sp. NPDC049525 TaxID=3154730 RepID=UPI00343D0BFD
MRSIEELRQAMRDETRDLEPQATFGQIRQRARRRRFTGLVAFAAAVLVPVGATMTALAGGPAGPAPSPTLGHSRPAPAVTNFVSGTELPGVGPLIRTGIAYGAQEELVFRYADEMNGVFAGLYTEKTTQFRRFDFGINVSAAGGFSTIMEIEDRNGGIVDYGMVKGADLRVDVTWDGQHAEAATTGVPDMPGTTLFWVRRTGIAAGPTGMVNEAAPKLVFTARDAAGTVVATGGDEVQRSDGAIVIADDAVPIGDPMPTGVVLADGGKLVLWFAGDAAGAHLHAGSDNGNGQLTEVRDLGIYKRPPFDIGFYLGRDEFDQPGGTKVVLLVYVGPGDKVTLAAPVSTGHGSVRWSAHPQLHIGWISGVPQQSAHKVTGFATAADGTVLAVTGDR